MKRSLHIIHPLSVIILLALVLCSAAQFTTAQTRGRNRAKPAAKTQAQPEERARRAKALTLLNETADDARAIEDLLYRARLQALAADALWPFDQQRARATFRRAWEAATASDEGEDVAGTLRHGQTSDWVLITTETRNEVLAKTAARDTELADVFLRDLMKRTEAEESDPGQDDPARSLLGRALSATDERRIALGLELLSKGETENALKIVAPTINQGTSYSLMDFMLRLREQNATLGDTLYALMIAALRADAKASSNDVLLLSTPIISPQLLITVDERGSVNFLRADHTVSQRASPPVAPAIRRAFLAAAANVLLRPAPVGASEAQDKAARYFTIGRLLPFYEREAPQYAPELQARMVTLSNDFSEHGRASLSSQLDLHTIGAPPSTDPLHSDIEELARTSDTAERDRITLRIILTAARNRFWDRARRAAAELSDDNARRAAYTFIAINQIADLSRTYAGEKEDDYESIVSFLKKVDVPPLAAAWGYAQAAQVAARKKDTQRVAELLTEATHYAGRVDADTSLRVAAYGLVAQHAARLDQQRAWELLTEVVKAANALEDYTGDETAIEIKIDENAVTTDTESPFTVAFDAFRLDTIFATMAQLDFARALSNARTLNARVPRVFAQLAIARATLEKK